MPWFANPARYEQMQYRYCGKKRFAPARTVAGFVR